MTTQWAWHMLIAADNDLCRTVGGQVAQLARANPRYIAVAAQLDSPGKRARRHALRKNGTFPRLPAKRGMRRNLNAGSKQSLVDFLIASRRLRKAPSIVVVFSSHGTGIADLERFGNARPVAKDQIFVRKGAFALGVDNTSNDFLDNNELQEGLEYAYRGHPRPKIIGCDACLMATVEVAHQLRDCAEILVASQHITPARGWPYERMLRRFSNRTKPLQAAKEMVKAYRNMKTSENMTDATLSAVKLDRMTDLARALDRFGGELLPFIQGDLRKLAAARADARTFANFDSIDLRGFLESVKSKFTSGNGNGHGRDVTAAADAVIDILDDAIICTSNDPEQSRAWGLSVYLPNSRVIDAYHDLPLSKAATQWHDFVVAYGAMRHLI